MVFAVHDSGFVARCAFEIDDAAGNRLSQIMDIVSNCKYGIHDVSRTQLHRQLRLPRFNMPLELGIFLGAQRFGSDRHRQKCCLVLDKERYRYQKFISDIAGSDVHSHGNRPEQIIREIRNWLRTSSGRANIPGATTMVKRFQQFQKDLPIIARELKLDPKELIFVDYTYVVADWLLINAS